MIDLETLKSPLVVDIFQDLSKLVEKLQVLDDKLTLKAVREVPKLKKSNSVYYVLNCQNKKFKTPLETIQKVPGSKLANLTQKLLVNQDGSIHIDRDPVIFEHVLHYLDSDRQFMPTHVSTSVKK